MDDRIGGSQRTFESSEVLFAAETGDGGKTDQQNPSAEQVGQVPSEFPNVVILNDGEINTKEPVDRDEPLSPTEKESIKKLESALTSSKLEVVEGLLKTLSSENPQVIDRVLKELSKKLEKTLEGKNDPGGLPSQVESDIDWSITSNANGVKGIQFSMLTATNRRNILGGYNVQISINSNGESTAQQGIGYHIGASDNVITHLDQSVIPAQALSLMFKVK
jgi:hypothetical protein